MEKKETRNKKQNREQTEAKEEEFEEIGTKGFPKDVDFKKFLGCGG